MRPFLETVLPFLLPSLIYFLYLYFRRRAGGPQGQEIDVPWAWLAGAGLALVAVTFAALALFGGAQPGATYHPAQVIDGKIEEGHFGN